MLVTTARPFPVLLLMLAAPGCGGPERAGDPVPEAESPPRAATPATCMPAGLEGAAELEVVRLPQGCTFASPGTLEAPAVVTDLATAASCTGSATMPTIDLSSSQLMVASFSMSPAFGGLAVVDDGTMVTFVMRDRPPCPGDPMPMPTPFPGGVAFRLPRDAARTYQQLACTLPQRCD